MFVIVITRIFIKNKFNRIKKFSNVGPIVTHREASDIPRQKRKYCDNM